MNNMKQLLEVMLNLCPSNYTQ